VHRRLGAGSARAAMPPPADPEPARGRCASVQSGDRACTLGVFIALDRRAQAWLRTTGSTPCRRTTPLRRRTARSNAFSVTGAIPADSDRPLRPMRRSRPAASP
jgi:hypothetical protein